VAYLRNLLLSSVLLALPVAATAQPIPSAIVLKPLRIELPAGEARTVEVDFGDALVGGVLYKAELPEMEISRDAVSLGFVEPRESKTSRRDDTPLEGERVALARWGTPLGLRVVAGPCCTGIAPQHIELFPPPGSRTPKGPVWPVRLPVEIVVRPDSKACHRGWISLVIGVVGGLAALYAYGMVLQSHFLNSKDLARRIEALRWDETGDLRGHSAVDVQALVKRELTPWRRAWNWLRANPLVFGFPGKAYHETVELHLQPGQDIHASRLILCPTRELHRDLEKDPGRAEGRLFATALSGTRFFTVPHRGSRIGALVLDRPGDLPRELVWLRSDERLLRNTEEREGFAGWKLHSQGGPR
jgi:hypothetical protein